MTLAHCCSIHGNKGLNLNGHFTNGESVLTDAAKKFIVYGWYKKSAVSHHVEKQERSKRGDATTQNEQLFKEFLTNFDIEKTEEIPAIKENKTESSPTGSFSR